MGSKYTCYDRTMNKILIVKEYKVEKNSVFLERGGESGKG